MLVSSYMREFILCFACLCAAVAGREAQYADANADVGDGIILWLDHPTAW